MACCAWSTTVCTSRWRSARTAGTSAPGTFPSRRRAGCSGPPACSAPPAATRRRPRAARRAGASYLGVGPAFATTTKAGLPDPLGPAVIGEVAAAVPDTPIVAIGGVTAANAGSLIAAGAAAVAVVGAIANAADPGRAAGEMLAALA
nr:hypothetical protein GCM10020092_099220 [Actinoplanes digitatis]